MLTRSEWTADFKSRLADLPAEEQKKAEDYYAELFEDKYESGMSEKQIIDSFGPPAEAAEAVIGAFRAENPGWSPAKETKRASGFQPAYNYEKPQGKGEQKEKQRPFAPAYNYASRPANNGDKDENAVGILLCVLVGLCLYPLAVALALGVLGAVFGSLIGGGAGVVYTIVAAVADGAFFFPDLGASLILLGIGAALVYPAIFGCEQMFGGIKKLFGVIRRSFV